MRRFSSLVSSLEKSIILWFFVAIATIDFFMFFSLSGVSAWEIGVNTFIDVIILTISFYRFDKPKTYYLIGLILLPCVFYFIKFNIHILREPIFWVIFLKSLALSLLIKISDRTTLVKYKVLRYTIYIIPFLIIVVLNIFYILTDLSAPSWDSARHGTNAFKVFDVFFSGDGIFDTWMFYDFYPSLGYIVTIPFQILFGRNNDALVFSILFLWFPLAYFYSIKIFREIFLIKDGKESILIFVFHSNVMLLSLLKQFMLDYQLFSLFIVQFYFLATSESFTKTRNILIGGMLCGIGFMIKESYLVYALILFASYFLFTFGAKVMLWSAAIWNDFYLKAGITCLMIGIFAVPWFTGWSFLFNWEMKGAGSYEVSGRTEGDPYPLSIDSFLWYFDAFVYFFTWPILFFLILGFFRVLRDEFKSITLMNLIALIGVWSIFTVLWNKDFRFVLPSILFFIPAFVGITRFNGMFSRIALATCLILSLIINFVQAFPKLHTSSSAGFLSPYVKKHDGIFSVNTALSFAVAHKFLLKDGISDLELEIINETIDYNVFNREFYRHQLRVPAALTFLNVDSAKIRNEVASWQGNSIYRRLEIPDSSNYILLRDSLYPFYLFLKIKSHSNSVSFENKGEYGRIKGKVKFVLNRKDTLEFENRLVIPRNRGEKIEVKAIVLHSNSRWPLIFRQHFTGEIALKENLSLKCFDMIPLRSNSLRNSIVVE